MKLKNKIKLVYKKIIIQLFLIIYKKPIYKNSLKLNNFHVKKFNIDKKKYKIYEINKGRVFTNKNDVTAYITSDNIITEGSMQFKKWDVINSRNQKLIDNIVLKNGTPNFKKNYNGNILSILSGGAARENFTHWFTDVIPRIMIFKKKFNLDDIDFIYVPSIKYKYQIESLDLLDIKLSKIISSEKIKHIQANKIFYTSHPCEYYPSKTQKWSLDLLRKYYIPKKIKKNEKFRYIFIDRDQLKLVDTQNLKNFATWRVLLNEDEIKNYLKTLGFKIIKPEKFSLKEQIEIFYSAEVIVSLFGAAMMMLAFCNSKAKIIEIKPHKSGNEFKNISNKLLLKHEQIKIEPKIYSEVPQNGLIFCNLDLLKEKFKKMKINFK